MGGRCRCSERGRVGCCGKCGRSFLKIFGVALNILIVAVGLAVLIARIYLKFNDETRVQTALTEVGLVYAEGSCAYTFTWVILYLGFLIAVALYLVAVGALGLAFVFHQTLQLFLVSVISSTFVLLICLAIGIGVPVCTSLDAESEVGVSVLWSRFAVEKEYLSRTTDDEFWNLVDYTQSEEKCCGYDGPWDYTSIGFSSKYSLDYPYSCCALKPGLEPNEHVTLDDVDWRQCRRGGSLHYNSPCGVKLKNATDTVDKPGSDVINYTYAAALIVAGLMAVTMAFVILIFYNPS